ncbi:head-tail connector protein [Salinibacillus xinjiangensis]|uniref:DUF4054 domain-containing protein n=1 Tax=Salinibacillus xinjiangensis TaxID=1229268 RepID=A0A6G1X7M1_9BACI|nr:hypothetical protein [Salinibacillus xinjiangensis]MRG87001.1 hypothetical protein [Salinibacillus xinjiangensis]
MTYIDKAYYDGEYKGTPVGDVDEFARLEQRAGEVIDELTNYTIANYEFTQLATFVQEQVKKATAAQVEHYVLNGGYEAIQGENLSNVRIGSFSYTEESASNEVSQKAYKLLAPTGLLYRGLGVRHGY